LFLKEISGKWAYRRKARGGCRYCLRKSQSFSVYLWMEMYILLRHPGRRRCKPFLESYFPLNGKGRDMSKLLTIQKDFRYLLESITDQVLETLAQGDILAQTITEQG